MLYRWLARSPVVGAVGVDVDIDDDRSGEAITAAESELELRLDVIYADDDGRRDMTFF